MDKVKSLNTVFLIFWIVSGLFALPPGDKNLNFSHGRTSNSPRHCEAITIRTCDGLSYNVSSFPNLMGHSTQEEANYDIHQYYPLVKVNCSPFIKIFICALYVPKCNNTNQALPPCRSLCENARSGCEKLMQSFGFTWPESFKCSRFADSGHCYGGDIDIPQRPLSENSGPTTSPSFPIREYIMKNIIAGVVNLMLNMLE